MKEGIVPRMEAQFKLARYHIAEKQTFKAAQALSGIFMGQPPLGEADNVQLYTAVGILFQQIGTFVRPDSVSYVCVTRRTLRRHEAKSGLFPAASCAVPNPVCSLGRRGILAT